ncbi:hypothetical protein YC2023_010769 [Brassica napus]
MTNTTVFLSDLKTGCCSSTVQVRLLCYWEARNVQRGEELMGVDMLLLNYQVVKKYEDVKVIVAGDDDSTI